ncbi:hypothetical protein LCGC14_2103900, partial [marine sediment metagenome]
RRWKTLLVAVALVLAAGGSAWYWQATAVDRQVNALLDQVRKEEPGVGARWLSNLGLRKVRQRRGWDEVADDLGQRGTEGQIP